MPFAAEGVTKLKCHKEQSTMKIPAFLRYAVFALFLCAFWAALFVLYLVMPGLSPEFSFAFAGLFSIAHAAEFALISLLVMCILAFLPGRAGPALSVGLAFGVSLYLVINYFVYKQFRMHLDFAALSMFFGDAGKAVFVFPPVMYVQAAAGTAAILALVCWFWRASGRAAKAGIKRRVKRAYIFLFICILSFHGIAVWAKFNLYTPVVSKFASLPLVQPLTMNETLQKLGFEEARDLPRFSVNAMNYPLAPLEYKKPEEYLNLIVIMLDGWRFDAMNEENTPNMYAFFRRSLRFNQHNATANHTRHGVFSFFYGLPGIYWDAAFTGRVSPVLIDAFSSAGYTFGVFASAPLTNPEFHWTVFSKLEHIDYYTDGDSTPERDRTITKKFLNFINTLEPGRPFFSFLFYDSTHAYLYDPNIYTPKYLPDRQKNYLASGKGKQQLEFNQYRNSVGYVDFLLKDVFAALEAKGLLENSVVILTSDHGEEFDDLGLGYSGHNGNFSKHQVRVPLLIHWPGHDAAEYDYLTSHFDIAPTLMEKLLGCASPREQYSTGKSLFEPGRDYTFMMGRSGSYGIQEGDIITVFPPIGPSYSVDANDYSPTEQKIPMALYRKVLHDLALFMR